MDLMQESKLNPNRRMDPWNAGGKEIGNQLQKPEPGQELPRRLKIH
jgi:hypothetical protein